MKIKLPFFLFFYCLRFINTHAQTDSIQPDSLKQRIIVTDSILVEQNNIELNQKKSKKAHKDFIRNWNSVDSSRITNPFKFHSQVNQESVKDIQQIKNLPSTNYNYYFVLFFLFIVCVILYSRIFPFKFRVENSAFLSRTYLSEILSSDYEWLDTNKIFPFIITSLFFSSFIFSPLLNFFSAIHYSYILFVVSILIFIILFSMLRFFQIVISHALDFVEIMSIFSRISLNTIYVLTLVCFPIIILILSVVRINVFEQPSSVIAILVIFYSIRTIKSLVACLKIEQRQIIYLIIYLCTLEIPMLLISIKSISSNTHL